MQKSDLVRLLALDTGVGKEECLDVLDAMIYEITRALSKGETVTIGNFLTFEISRKNARHARNPHTGEIVLNPPVNVIKCRASKSVKDAINSRG